MNKTKNKNTLRFDISSITVSNLRAYTKSYSREAVTNTNFIINTFVEKTFHRVFTAHSV